MAERLTLHEDPRSGNCYKIKLTAALLGRPIQTRQYDILKGETRTPDFLGVVNANGRIPVLQIGGDEAGGEGARFLPESNAACWYLAAGSHLVPADPFEQANILRWMFFEQYQHEPNIATLRFWLRFVGDSNLSDEQCMLMPGKRVAGEAALALMDQELAEKPYLCGHSLMLADLALFAYTHVAHEAGFDMGGFAHLREWIERIEQTRGFTPMS